MNDNRPSISIIMPCHNRGYDLHRVLDAYASQKCTEPFEIIAIDDASTDLTYATLTSYTSPRYTLRVDRLEKNQGPGAARNKGIMLAAAPLIAFVGDDIVPEANFIQNHLRAHRRLNHQEIAILGNVRWAPDLPQNTLMKFIDGPGAQQFSYYWLKDGQAYDYRHFYTSNVSIKTDFLRASSELFDLSFKYAAFEDAELAYRLAHRGMRIIYTRNIQAYHYHYHTIWSFSKRQFVSGLMARIFLQKHPNCVRTILRASHVRLIVRTLWHRNMLSNEVITSLEQQLLHLCCYYEWSPNEVLDQLYLRTLDYYYLKGILFGLFGNKPIWSRVQSNHVEQSLRPILEWFIAEAFSKHIDLPEGIDRSITGSRLA